MNRKQRLMLAQADRKLRPFSGLVNIPPTENGWTNLIRKSLNMSLRQLADKTGSTPQGIKAMENREKTGAITLKSLQEIAGAMEMKLVYAFVPVDGSLEELVNKKATEKAREIVSRTSQSMKLEDQENAKERISKAIEEKKNELANEIPKFLWD